MAENHSHPTVRQYVQIALLLTAITAIEVALFYVDKSVDMRGWDAPALIVLSSLKFVLVVSWFMHLRYEKPLLARFFSIGFFLALGLYAVVLAALGVMVIRG